MEQPNNNMIMNKGNYSLDTDERELRFNQIRGAGWEEEYAAYRNNWAALPQNAIVSEYPLLVDIELSTVCNLKCPMCYTITEEFKSRVGCNFMDWSLFTRIIDEIAGHVPAIRLSLRGEPTLHPDFIKCVEYAKKKGIREISFLTNGSNLSEKSFQEIMLAGADWIIISIDGLYDTYESIRKPMTFENIFETVAMIKRIKQAHYSEKPVIKIQSIWPAIRGNPGEFYDKFLAYADLIAFNPIIDFSGSHKGAKIIYEENFSCPQLYQRIIITSDGSYLMCSNDENQTEIIGNAYNETVYSAWHGENLTRIRNLHKEKDGFKNIQACRECYIPRKTVENETAVVHGRVITIKNYI